MHIFRATFIRDTMTLKQIREHKKELGKILRALGAISNQCSQQQLDILRQLNDLDDLERAHPRRRIAA